MNLVYTITQFTIFSDNREKTEIAWGLYILFLWKGVWETSYSKQKLKKLH